MRCKKKRPPHGHTSKLRCGGYNCVEKIAPLIENGSKTNYGTEML
jgi:hypothetical protein